MISKKYVEQLFGNLKNAPAKFFEKVSDEVDWTIMGTHPLAGVYHGKADFINRASKRINSLLRDGIVLVVNNILVDGDQAAVEMKSLSTQLNGKPFDNTYCWVVEFRDDTIIRVRAYLDSALVQQLIDENSPPLS